MTKDDVFALLLKAADLQEKADKAHENCKKCEGQEDPDLCPKCFPKSDDARCKRREAISAAKKLAKMSAQPQSRTQPAQAKDGGAHGPA